MEAETCVVDEEGRVTLPKSFAGLNVRVQLIERGRLLIESVTSPCSDTGTTSFPEERPILIADRHWDEVDRLLESPPASNEALKRLMAPREPKRG